MALPNNKVELGLDFTNVESGPFFKLNDDTQGRLDNEEFRLGGTLFFDVTDRVKNFQISRGKPRRFSTFPAGGGGVRFNNHDRAFDPLNTSSPFNTQIIPRREIRISVGTAVQFTGFVDDWNLQYTLDGDSTADAVAADVTSWFAKQILAAGTPVEEFSGSRINNILDSPEVDWSDSLRVIDSGNKILGTQEIAANTNALSYMQKVAETEQGLLFINKEGAIRYQVVEGFPTSDSLTVFGQETGIAYSGIQVIYGSELLYNEVAIANEGGQTAIATNADSIAEYGIRSLAITDLLGNSDSQSVTLANNLVRQYAQPEYRIELLQVNLHSLTESEQNEVLALEIGDTTKVEFKPNDIGDKIERFVRIISIKHDVNPEVHIVRFGFQETQLRIVLDDAVFGKLDIGTLA